MEDIFEIIRKHVAGLSPAQKKELANKCGVVPRTIDHWATNRNSPRKEHIPVIR